ncbi:MAG TPA: sulfatase-like hydrolase/transferase [Polyangia bacterium]
MRERRNQLRRTVCGAIVTGVLSGLVVALVELAYVFAMGTGPTAGGARFALYVAMLLTGFGGVIGALEGALVFGLARGAEALGRRRTNEARWTARLYAAVLTPGVALFCAQIFRGRFARTIPFHDGIAVLIGVALLYAIFRGVVLILAARERLRAGAVSPWRARVLGLGLLALAVGLYLADQRVLPRLYPHLHAALAAGTLILVQLGLGVLYLAGQRTGSRLGRLAEPALALSLLLASSAGAVSALAGLSRSQGLRFVALEHTAATQKALALAAGVRLWPRRALGPAAPLTAAPAVAAVKLPQGPRLPGADVFLITIDAVRADHVGAYGYPRPTTPSIDALAKSGVVFDRAYAQVPHTSFSLSTLMTGKYLYSLAALGDRQRHETLPTILRRYGYKTAGFFPPSVFFIDAQKFTAYEESRFDFEYVKYEYLDAARRVDQAIDFLGREQPPHVFVWTHFFEPHEPYDPHPGHVFGTSAMDRYDGEIAYVDEHVGRYVRWIRAHRPNAVIIVSADHGEEFGEHGGHYHATTVYDEQIRVPLVVNAAGVAPRHVPGQAELIDVPSTILGLLDLPLPVRMRGTDLTPWMGDPPAPPEALPAAFGEVEQKKMVVRWPHKLVCDLGRGFCELYDLTSDPAEKRNLVDARPDLVARLRGDLDGWIGSHLAYEQRPEELSGSERRRRALERGRLGDAGAVPELARLLGEPDPATRRAAARLLMTLRVPPARAALVRVLADPDPEVRRWAAAGAAPDSPPARTAALAVLADAAAPEEARLWAAIGLGDAGDTTGVPLLAHAVATSCRVVADGSNADGRCVGQIDPALARDITVLLGTLKDARAVPDLLEARSIVRLRKEAVQALGRIGDRRAAAPLARELTEEPRIEVRAELAAALERLGDPRGVPALAQAFARETEPQVARALFQALCALGGARGAHAADLRRWQAGAHAVALSAARHPGERLDLWLYAAPGARGRVGVRLGAAVVGAVDLEPAERVYTVALPEGVPPRGPLHFTLLPEAGAPRLDTVLLRALKPEPSSRPASQPASAPHAGR